MMLNEKINNSDKYNFQDYIKLMTVDIFYYYFLYLSNKFRELHTKKKQNLHNKRTSRTQSFIM